MGYKDYEDLLLEQTGSVLRVTVNRPEVLNAQSRIMREELDHALLTAAADESVRVIIIAGAGRHFSAGHDLGSPQELEDQKRRPYAPGLPGQYQRNWELNVENTLRWRDLPKPTIAQVQGYCIMGGFILASACDLIVASEDAMFCDRTVRWDGSHVQYFSMPWEIGFRRAKEYLFTGDWLTAEEAYRAGLVNRVVPLERLEEETMALAQRIALNDPFALRLAKASVNQAQDIAGYRTAILGSFQTYAASLGYRAVTDRETGRTRLSGAERARARDARFGDNPSPRRSSPAPAGEAAKEA
jgi:enoyl-CoA hydratase